MTNLDRREFTSLTAGAACAAGLSPISGPPQKGFRKAVKIGMVKAGKTLAEKFAVVKELGFDGIELDSPNGYATKEVLAARDKVGLPIHGVVDSAHWRDTLSHPKPEVREKGVKALRTAIDDAAAYGASTVLLVPAVVNKAVSYQAAYERSQAEIGKVLPYAGEKGIRIALENVWNNFLLSPMEMARYIDEFDSPWIGCYLDAGNLVRYGWPEHWVETLGRRIFKVDVKDYSRKKQRDEGIWKGFQAKIGDGDTDWPKVTEALRKTGYDGWFTAEVSGGDRKRLQEIAQRMDAFLKA